MGHYRNYHRPLLSPYPGGPGVCAAFFKEGQAQPAWEHSRPKVAYVNARNEEGVDLSINEPEAAIVRRIFEMAAQGGSRKAIAKTLNGEHISPPPPETRQGFGHVVSERDSRNASP